jgi:hypothetical protein
MGLFRTMAFTLLIVVGAISHVAAQDGRRPEGSPLALSFTEGVGIEAETGEPGALVIRELLSASEGRS